MKPLAFICLGITLSIPLWFAASYAVVHDVHRDLHECRLSLSAFIEREGRP